MAVGEPGYDAFISYSHRQDASITARLQAGMQRFARPWYRARALRVFRDETSLAASPHLWTSIEEALGRSRWMILIASPDSAGSSWVDREIGWWRERRPMTHMLIALTDGDLSWDPGARDLNWPATTALSRLALEQAFPAEPRWVDLRWARGPGSETGRGDPRLQNAVAELAAAIRHVPKDALIGEHVREQRKTRRVIAATALALVLLLAASVTSAILALGQRDRAVAQTRRANQQAAIAEAGLLANLARSLAASRLDLAQLFAAQAYRLSQDPQTRSALFATVTADPHLVRFLHASGRVSAVATSADGRTIAAGTASGQVQRWQLPDLARSPVFRVHGRVNGIAVSDHGTTIAAISGQELTVWRAGAGVTRHRLPGRDSPTATAVSPSGDAAVVGAAATGLARSPIVYLLTLATGQARSARLPGIPEITTLAYPSADRVTAFDSIDGTWARLSVPGLHVIGAQRRGSFGAHRYAAALSPSGRFMTFSNGGPSVGVWPVRSGVTAYDRPALVARTGGKLPTTLALSSDGHRAADAEATVVYVSRASPPGSPVAMPIPLRGGGSAGPGGLTFLGDSDSRLVSASGDLLALWDLNQYSRDGREVPIDLPMACGGCAGPRIAVSPDSGRAIITGGLGSRPAIVVRLGRSLGQPHVIPTAASSGAAAVAVWTRSGRRIFLMDPAGGVGQVRSAEGSMPVVAWFRQPGFGSAAATDSLVAAKLAANGKEIIEVSASGAIRVLGIRPVSLQRAIKGPLPGSVPGDRRQFGAATDPRGSREAVISWSGGAGESGPVHVMDLATRRSRTVPGPPAAGVAYDREHLLILRANGTLEVRSADGMALLRSLSMSTAQVAAGPVVSPSGTVVVTDIGGKAVVADARSGAVIGSIPVRGGPLSALTAIALTPDGQNLVMAAEGLPGRAPGTLTELGMSAGGWLKIACATAGHDLSRQDWRANVSLRPPGNLRCTG